MSLRKKPLVVVTRRLPDSVETRMRELFDARLNLNDEKMSQEALIEAVRTATVLVPTINDRVDAALIEAAGDNLKLIANFGNGVDNIDVEAATARKITGKRLGIIGMGRIGQALARRAKAFGLQVHYHNRHHVDAAIETELEATYWDSLDQMLARMDIISVNCPHTPATYHLLSARRLKLIKREALIVNTARGEVIDETTLAKMLDAGEIAGAGLDVFEHEPAVNPRLVKLAKSGRVVLLPHMGSATIEGRTDMGEKVIVNIRAFVDGHSPPDRVLPSML
jgi:glyoxylate reductase